MANPTLFQYSVIFHPTEKEIKDDGAKSKVLVEIKTILAKDASAVQMTAAMEIPAEYKDKLDQIQIALRPF